MNVVGHEKDGTGTASVSKNELEYWLFGTFENYVFLTNKILGEFSTGQNKRNFSIYYPGCPKTWNDGPGTEDRREQKKLIKVSEFSS